MQTKTETILSALLPRLRREYIDHRPEMMLAQREFQALYEEFHQTHRNNPRLLSDVDDLLDAQAGWDAVDKECSFLLGIRIGLDLGGLDVFSDF